MTLLEWFKPSPEELWALMISLRVAGWCVLVTAVPGIFLGWLLARKKFRGRILLEVLIHMPLVLPPVVVGYLLLSLMGNRGPAGWLGLHVAFTWQAAVIASAVMGFPLMVRSVRLAIEMVDWRLEQAARTLGAGPLRVFFTLTLPLAFPGVVTGLILAFARSLGEFGATLIFAGNIEGQTRTLSLAVFTYAQRPDGDAQAMRLVVISIGVSFAALLLSEWLAARGRARLEGP